MSKSADKSFESSNQEDVISTSYSRSLIYAEYAFGRSTWVSSSSSKLEESFDAELSVEREVIKIKVPGTYSIDVNKSACELITETALADVAARTMRSLGKEVHFAWPSCFTMYEGNTSESQTIAELNRGINQLYISCGSSSETLL